MLLAFGIEQGDHKEVRRDFEHLRRWRRSVEQAEATPSRLWLLWSLAASSGLFGLA
jgi:hypothetical protein